MFLLFAAAALILILLLLGIAQAVMFVVKRFTRTRFRPESALDAPADIMEELRRLRDTALISSETFEQVARALDISRGRLPARSPEPPPLARVVAAHMPPPLPALPLTEGQTAGAAVPLVSSPSVASTESELPKPIPSEPGSLFAAFLERRNIRWGELLGGLLILGCSTALVVSFWAQIAERPIFKFALFTLATAAFFGVGLYSEHRWKLPTTSRAILLLSTLLVPVNVLAFSAFGASGHGGGLPILAQIAGLVIFTLLVWPAARVIAGPHSVVLTAGLAATCLGLIAVAAHSMTSDTALRLAAIPVGCFLVCSAFVFMRLWRMQSIDSGAANSAYACLGVIGVAAWLAVGFLLFGAPSLSDAASALSPIFTALALPPFAIGLVIWKRADRLWDDRGALVGLAVGIFGWAIMLAALLTAWPVIGWLVPMAAFDAIILFATAIAFDLPTAYFPATILSAGAILVGFQTWRLGLPVMSATPTRLIEALSYNENGWLLLPMSALLGVAARLANARHGRTLGWLALLISAWAYLLAIAGKGFQQWNPLYLELVIGTGYCIIWLTGQRGKSWAIIGTLLPLLTVELQLLNPSFPVANPLPRTSMGMLPIAVGMMVAIALGWILFARKRQIRPGDCFAAGLLEAAAVAILMRSRIAATFDDVLQVFRLGHVVTACGTFGCGAWIRAVTDRSIALAIPMDATDPPSAGPAVIGYRTPNVASDRGGRRVWVGRTGIIPETFQWTTVAILLGVAVCLPFTVAPTVSAAAAVVLSVLIGALAIWADVPSYFYLGALLLNFGASVTLYASPMRAGMDLRQLYFVNVGVLAFSGGIALLLDRLILSHRRAEASRDFGFHVFSGWFALLLLCLTFALQQADLLSRMPADVWTWAALGAVACLAIGRLVFDDRADAAALLHLCGLLGVSYYLEKLSPPIAIIEAALGLYGIVTAGLGVVGLTAWKSPDRRRDAARDWFIVATSAFAVCALVGAFYGDITDLARTPAMAIALIAIGQGAAIGLFARRGRPIRLMALAATAIGMAELAWAILPIAHRHESFNVGAVVIAALSIFASALVGTRRLFSAEWRSAMTTSLSAAVGAMAILTLVIVAGEIALSFDGPPPAIALLAIIGIECELVLALAGSIIAAVGPFAISRRVRSACVWAAEGLAVLALVHLRITEPTWFDHRLERYWPIIVLGIAFVLTSAGIWLNHRGRRDLGTPMEHSGIGWPVIAIFGYWLLPSIVDYSAVLWIGGVLYGIVAASRRSLIFSLVAVACINGGLWFVFSRYPGTSFLAHPQLWIIPAALSVLAAAQMHREKLSAKSIRNVRYLCLAVVYLSSTADILLNGVMIEPWLPMVLAAFAIVGVLAGIAWHIRPFLYLGMTFLLIAVLSMIWTAQQDLHWTWLWYVAGLAAGVGLLTVFGLFEKRHEQMTRLISNLREWE